MDRAPSTRLLASKVQRNLVIFMCNHCPFVVHIAEELARLGQDYPETRHRHRGHQRERRGELPR